MAALIDKTTGLLYQVKRPSPETRLYSVDFKKLLTGIASVTSVEAQARGLVSEVEALSISNISSTGSVVFFRASGGTDKEDYEIKLVVVDTNGNTISDDVMLKVRIAGTIA